MSSKCAFDAFVGTQLWKIPWSKSGWEGSPRANLRDLTLTLITLVFSQHVPSFTVNGANSSSSPEDCVERISSRRKACLVVLSSGTVNSESWGILAFTTSRCCPAISPSLLALRILPCAGSPPCQRRPCVSHIA
jgi:hypothetical protein